MLNTTHIEPSVEGWEERKKEGEDHLQKNHPSNSLVIRIVVVVVGMVYT